ncbi:glycosyltransferase [Herbiconiux sp. CPCC 203407]|uniref:Glycosyltransferase n=1 Tax=Herbiconiux oxytropis TaxID=2970915 RepID=A0AA42BX15_9MICO|nr:glycosyltransferase family 2 protein [Herbiconiux oxytropis]MCS5723243.1 glycosyltransferase [Herbiconiux oxytropis]MCS5727898.1 glycosyltransferase [Herbiconiux oxytropis]
MSAHIPDGEDTVIATVILPIHNASSYLDRAFENVRATLGDDTELVIVDDHSTDDSWEKVQRWAEHLPGRVVVIANEGRGVAAARNLAVSRATGDFVWFVDCDDDWRPEIVKHMVDLARQTGADIVLSNAEKVSQPSGETSVIEDAASRDVITGQEAFSRLLLGEIEGHLWNKLFRRTLFSSAPFPATRAHSDLGGMFGLFSAASVVAALPEVLYTYYVHEGSVLNRRQYRWDDLWDCLQLARAGADDVAGGRPLTTFKYRNVIVPTVNESIRRETVAEASDIDRARKRARSATSISEAVRLALWGQRDAAARALLIKLAFPVYRGIYKRHRAKNWAELDSFAATPGSESTTIPR